MSVALNEHQNQTDIETSPRWQTFNIVRKNVNSETVIEKISTAQVTEESAMTGNDLQSAAEFQLRGTQPSIERPLYADMVVTDPNNPNHYTYLHMLGSSVDCFNVIRNEQDFTVNLSQNIPLERFVLELPEDTQTFISLQGRVEGYDKSDGKVEYQELEPEFVEALGIFDGCRQAAANVDPSTRVRERRKKSLLSSVLRHVA